MYLYTIIVSFNPTNIRVINKSDSPLTLYRKLVPSLHRVDQLFHLLLFLLIRKVRDDYLLD